MLAVDDQPYIHQNRELMSLWVARREALADVPNVLISDVICSHLHQNFARNQAGDDEPGPGFPLRGTRRCLEAQLPGHPRRPRWQQHRRRGRQGQAVPAGSSQLAISTPLVPERRSQML